MLQPRRDLLVLCYHAVSPTWSAQLAISPQTLARQLRVLEDRGYTGVRFSDAVLGAAQGARRVAVTFDDGYTSVLSLAKPVLDELGWPATLFVPTDHIGTGRPMCWPGIDTWLGGPEEHELMPLGWDELRELQSAGWEIGSHTCSHPHLTTLPDDDLRRELATAREVLERELGRPCRSIAYPYGDADDRVIDAAGRAGYRTGAALREEPHAAQALHWPRVGIYRADTAARYRRRVSRGMRLLARTPAGSPAIGAARRLASHLQPADAIEGTTPAMSLVAASGLLIRGRVRTIAAGLAGRMGASNVYLLWPEAHSPQLVTCPAAPHTVAWMTRRFEYFEHRREMRHPAGWAVVRARGAFVGRGTGDAVELAEAALGRSLADPRVALFRASESRWVKALAFVWHDGDDEPSIVVKRMPFPLDPCHLRHETEVLAALRPRLAGDPLAATLPPAPLLVHEGGHGYTVVEPVDPLGGRRTVPDRERALAWLRALHAATGTPRPWGADDEHALVEITRRTYGEAGLSGRDALCERIAEGLVSQRGADIPAVVEHRDFWAGNLATSGDELRVYDWEWTRLEGRPFFDLWTYELAGLRNTARAQRERDVPRLVASAQRVEAELVHRGIDPVFARLTLPAVIGELAFRGDWATGTRLPKLRSLEIMEAAGRLVT